jgi:hypothetical protein
MKTEFQSYLENIGIQPNAPYYERIEAIIHFYENLGITTIEDIFISEYLDKEGNRIYESLWLFTPVSVMEAKNFLTEENFDCALYDDLIRYWVIKKKDYDFNTSSADSRITIYFKVSERGFGGISGEIKASQNNCDYLINIFRKHVLRRSVLCSLP